MADNIVTLPYSTTEDIAAAAAFVAGLVPSGVTFTAEIIARKMHIHFLGGH